MWDWGLSLMSSMWVVGKDEGAEAVLALHDGWCHNLVNVRYLNPISARLKQF
jgi:hypothetical protein